MSKVWRYKRANTTTKRTKEEMMVKVNKEAPSSLILINLNLNKLLFLLNQITYSNSFQLGIMVS